jgi:hypothetical protein
MSGASKRSFLNHGMFLSHAVPHSLILADYRRPQGRVKSSLLPGRCVRLSRGVLGLPCTLLGGGGKSLTGAGPKNCMALLLTSQEILVAYAQFSLSSSRETKKGKIMVWYYAILRTSLHPQGGFFLPLGGKRGEACQGAGDGYSRHAARAAAHCA